MESFGSYHFTVKVDDASYKRLDSKGAVLQPDSDYNKLDEALDEIADEVHTDFSQRLKAVAKKHGVQLVVDMDVL